MLKTTPHEIKQWLESKNCTEVIYLSRDWDASDVWPVIEGLDSVDISNWSAESAQALVDCILQWRNSEFRHACPKHLVTDRLVGSEDMGGACTWAIRPSSWRLDACESQNAALMAAYASMRY